MPMKTIEGYSKEKYTNTSVLLAGGGAKALSDFIGSLSWDSTNKKIKYTPVGGSTTDLVTLSWDNIANKPTSLPANGGNADTSNRTKFLETFHQNSTTNTYGSQYPIWAQWSDATNVRLKCTNYTVWTDKADNAINADKLDGQHGSRYTSALGGSNCVTFTVEGDANTYYPVVITNTSDYYPMQLVNISRAYHETAPDTWNTSTHRGGLTLTLLWNGSRYWDGNTSGAACYCVYKNETYSSMVGGLGNSTGGKVVWLRGGGAVYHIHSMNGTSTTVTVYTSTYTDSASQSYAPKTSPEGITVRWPGYAGGADYASSAGSVAWSNVTGKPTNHVTTDTAQTITGEKTFATNIITISNPNGGDATLKLYRGGNTAWSIVDTVGNLKFNDLNSNTTRLTLFESSQGGYAKFADNVYSTGFNKEDSSNDYVLLGGGGHKAISDFATASHTHSNYIERLAWWNEGDSHNANDLLSGTTFAYRNHSNCPTTGTIVAFNCINSTEYPLQLQGNYYREELWFRNRNGDNGTWNAWRYIIHNGNIGSQSVNYASSAGNADTVDNVHLEWSGNQAASSTEWLAGWTSDGIKIKAVKRADLSVNYATTAGSASSSTYARYLTCPDTRSSAQSPGDYTATSTGVSFDFKESSVTGLSGYSGVMTFRPYSSAQDWTGGEVHQIAFLAGGGLYHRIGTSSWGSWERILTSSNWSSYISIPSVGNDTNYYPIRSYTSGLQISSYSGSTDCALFVPYATSNQAGVVSTEAQIFSGQKTFSSIRLSTTNFGGYLYFGDDSYAYLAELADDQLTLNATKIFLGISGSQKYYIDDTVFRPVTANSTSSSGIALGSSDYRFTCGYFSDKVYAYKGFYESSDERLKNILNPVKVNLDDLSKLRKVYYLWKDRTEDEIQLGMIAQDVQKLYPELVSVDKETGYLSLAYDKLSVLALEAIDVLYKEHKKLKKHVDELEKLLINNKIS